MNVFDYDSLTKLQVNKVTEYAENVAYNSLSFEYKTLLTTVTDNRGRTNHYRFNNYGQLINEQDYDGSAVYYDYETRTPGKKDNLAAASDILSTSMNLISNSSFEYNENYITSAWQIDNTSGTANNNSVIQLSNSSYIGDNSLQLFKSGAGGTSKVFTNVTVTPGKTYTVSLYYMGLMDAYIFAEYTDASGNTVTEEKELIRVNSDWNKNTLTVKIPSDAGTKLKVGIIEKGDTAIGFGSIDAVQVAENGTAERYNLIKNPDFTSNLTCWETNYFTTGDGYVNSSVGSEYKPDNLNDGVVKITGNINAGKSIHQNVGESGEANDSYIFGAFVRADAIPGFTHKAYNSSTTITYGSILLRVEFINGDTLVNQVNKSFSYDTSDWQYLSFNAKATGTFTRIKVSFHYARNLNAAYFDGVSLYKDGYGTAYTYDSKNNLQQVVTKEGKTYLYEYYDNNDLKKSTDEYGDITKYTYDEKHNVKTVTTIPKDSSINKITEYEYDTNGNVINTSSYDSRNTSKRYVSTSSYTNNYKDSDTDSRDNSVKYGYDSTGRLITVEDSKDTINYDYAKMGRISRVYTDNSNGQVWYSYTGDDLDGIILKSKTGVINLSYNLTHNTFGQLTNTYVNNQLLSTNTYNAYKQLTKTTYGNGYSRSYIYDSKDQLTEVLKVGNRSVAEYDYTDAGLISEVQDKEVQRKTMYDYDDEGRLIRELSEATGTYGGTKASVIYTYDYRDRVSAAINKIGDYSWTETYEYDNTNHLYDKVTTSDGVTANTTYDYIGRIEERVLGNNRAVVMDYDYEAGVKKDSVTSLVNYFYATGQSTKRYSYDETGLITQITATDGNIYYSYDEQSQLKAVIDNRSDTGTAYTYDDGGNITKKTIYNDISKNGDVAEIAYTYDSTWRDLLVSYDGESIEYDAIGNPTKYLEYETLSWTGRNLDYIKDGDAYVSIYAYDADGLRRVKQVGSTKTEYIYTDGQLSAMKVGNDMLYFTYDANGTLISVKYNDDIYYYVINPQGDVVGICNESGATVARYTYDEWGYPLSAPTSGIGALNPFRYRGYIYDAETGFYYVSSRYYDPETGRWLNADNCDVLTVEQGSILQYNLFAYCLNNPVNRYDDSGYLSLPNIAKVAIGAVAIAGLAVATVATGGAVAVICGAALSGAIAGGASGAVMGAIGGGITGGWQGALDGACSGFMSGTLIGGVTGAASAGLNIATGATTVVGNAHGSTLHKLATNMEAGKMAASGQYSQIGINKSLGKMGLNGGRLRPDVTGIAKKGLNKLVEVVSPRQSIISVTNKMSRMLNMNPRTTGKTVLWVRKLFRTR